MTSPASISCFLSILFVVTSFRAEAQEPPTNQATMAAQPTIGLQGGRFGLGFASSFPSYGISGTYQLHQKITVEAILGAFGVVSSYGGRMWFRFQPGQKYDLYGFGGVHAFRYSSFAFSETVFGLTAGAGAESGLQAIFDDASLPPIFFAAEIGVGFANFNQYGGYNLLNFGLNAHYRFGG